MPEGVTPTEAPKTPLVAAPPPPASPAAEAVSGKTDGAAPAAAPAKPGTVEYRGRQIDRNDAVMLKAVLSQQGENLPDEVSAFIDASPAPVASDKTSPEEKAPPKDGRAGGQNRQGDAAVDPAKLAAAREALKKWQWPDALINSLDPQELVDRGDKALKSQASINTLANESVEAKRKLEETLAEIEALKKQSPEPKPDGPAREAPRKEARVDKADLPKHGKDAFLEKIKNDEVYADLHDPLKGLIESIESQHQAGMEGYKAELAQRESRINSIQKAHEALLLDISRKSLIQDFPQLKDQAKFEKVKAKVYSLANLNGYHDEDGNPDIDRLMRDACRVELGEDIKQQQQSKLTERFKIQTDGQPADMSDRSERPVAAMTPEQKQVHGYQLLQSGKTPEQVRAILRQIPSA